MTAEELKDVFDHIKTAHELPNDNSGEYNLGYVDAMRMAMKQIDYLDDPKAYYTMVIESEAFNMAIEMLEKMQYTFMETTLIEDIDSTNLEKVSMALAALNKLKS